MCLGVPGQIVEIHDGSPPAATVEVSGTRRKIGLALLPAEDRVTSGDFVSVYMGMAMNRLSPEEAAETRAILEGFGEAYLEEAAARQAAAGAGAG